MACMPYFKEGGRGSLIPLVPGQRVTLGDGGGGEVNFIVKPHPCFADIATVRGTSSELRIKLQIHGDDPPPDGNEHSVGRQGVTIFDRSTGKPVLKIVHAGD